MRWRGLVATFAVAAVVSHLGCGGSAVERELGDAGETVAGGGDGPPATPEPATAAPPTAPGEPLPTGDEVRYGDRVFHVGDQVRLNRRVGLLTPAALGGDRQVEAAAGKTGRITSIRSADGLVEVTWDPQQWTIHGGYAWQDSPTIEVKEIEGATSISAGLVDLDSFTSTVHVGYLEVPGS